MSRFMTQMHRDIHVYTPGEQPQDKQYIKLNTNESPFPPSPGVLKAAAEAAGILQLYSDPDTRELTEAAARLYGVEPDQVLMTNGSDEILNFAFMTFCGPDRPAAFPDITYGFYPVFGELNRVDCLQIPLKEDFSVDYRDYCGIGRNIVLANPNAPTGLVLSNAEIEEILRTNPDHVVVIDEAYADYSGTTCLPLLKKYDNLLITRTFSKAYSMAGARLGLGIGSKELIRDLNAIKYSTNPYNINRMTGAAGLAAIRENDYYMENCRTICRTRDRTKKALEEMGFFVTDSHTNFIFAKSDAIGGRELYLALRDRGILGRHFDSPRTRDYIRVTVGTDEQMDRFLDAVREILDRK